MEQCERQRNSSIELLRIVAMMFIIMNHFAGHGVFEPLDKAGVVLSIDTITWQIVFTQLFNWGGGLGNTLFILITGYFMINKVVNYKKILLLLSTMFFYSWTIEILVYGLMGMPYNIKDIIRLTMPICFGENGFVSCYIIFSLFIPYINIFLNNLDKIKHLKLLCILFVFLIFLPALRFDTFMQGQLLFFGFCYAVGSYLRLYSQKYITNEWHNRYLTLFVLLMILMTLSIFLMDIVGVLLSKSIFLRKASYFGVIMKIPVAITLFLYFMGIGLTQLLSSLSKRARRVKQTCQWHVCSQSGEQAVLATWAEGCHGRSPATAHKEGEAHP